MMHHQRNNHQMMKKGAGIDDDCSSNNHMNNNNNNNNNTIVKPKFLYLLFLSLISCSFILAADLFASSPTFSLLYSIRFEDDEKLSSESHGNAPTLSTVFNGTTISCDRSLERSDVCTMTGDVRTNSLTSSIIMYVTKNNGDMSEDNNGGVIQREKIRPYTRKREESIMSIISELDLVVKPRSSGVDHRCNVWHDAPALFFSTGGYTGNLFHEFTDGIVPLFITSRQFNRKVIFVILEYHHWWISKYVEITSHLSDHEIIDFQTDNRTNCFVGATVGLWAHDDLQINPTLTADNTTIQDFRSFLDRAYSPRVSDMIREGDQIIMSHLKWAKKSKKPKLIIMARNESRMILNQNELIKMAEKMGFHVAVLVPDGTTSLARMYKIMNSSDAMVGVHGAALTHFLFLRPGSVFIQIVPIGIDWAAETYCEIPAIKMGMEYIDYKIWANESSLFDEYEEHDPVLTDPLSVNKKGWEYTKTTYLDHQNVRLNLARFRPSLLRAHLYLIRKLNGSLSSSS